MSINKNKKYKTRDGHPVRIYATDGGSNHDRVHGAIFSKHEAWSPISWNSDGKYYANLTSQYDLIEVPEYRPAEFPRDYGKACEFSDNKEFCEAIISTLRGYFPNHRYRWMADSKSSFQYARIKNED